MKRWKIIALSCLVAVCLGTFLGGCASNDYKPPLKTQAVSASALGQDTILRVGVNADTAPLAGKASNSADIVGIDVDIAASLADELGLKLEIVDVGSDFGTALSNGTVDIVLGVNSADTESAFWKSDPYIQTGVALFAPASTTSVPTTGSSPSIAAQVSSKSSWRITNLYGEDALVAESDLSSAFDTLSAGKAQYVAADAVIGTYVANGKNHDASIVALLQDPSGYCVGIAETNTELQQAVNSALQTLISGGIIDLVESKWLGAPLSLDKVTIVKTQVETTDEAEKTEPAEDQATSEGEGEADTSAQDDAAAALAETQQSAPNNAEQQAQQPLDNNAQQPPNNAQQPPNNA